MGDISTKTQSKKSVNENPLRRLSVYLLFDLLGILCVVLSAGYALVFDENIRLFISNLLIEFNEGIMQLVILVILWTGILLFLVIWTSRIRNSYRKENQDNIVKDVEEMLNLKRD